MLLIDERPEEVTDFKRTVGAEVISSTFDESAERHSQVTEIVLENVKVPADCLIAEEGKGFTIALDTLDGGRLGIASQSLGIAAAAIELIREIELLLDTTLTRQEKESAMGIRTINQIVDYVADLAPTRT